MNLEVILRLLRYFVSLVSAPIARTGVRIFCIRKRWRRLRIEKWTFVGSVDFLNLIEDAKKKILKCDPKIIKEMTSSLTVMNIGDEVVSAPDWGLCTISNSYIAWGADGVLAVWIYFIYHCLARKDRWMNTAAENSFEAYRQSRVKAALWLREHQFPEELCEAINKPKIV